MRACVHGMDATQVGAGLGEGKPTTRMATERHKDAAVYANVSGTSVQRWRQGLAGPAWNG